ncbi:MAG: nucleoside deaminase [Gemmataceae bacterium]|nr:nucleoside deaminase [Gemmataceae bacterium]
MESDFHQLEFQDGSHPFHRAHMEMALEEARLAESENEVPVGAVIVSLEKGVIGRGHNQREGLRDPTAHAEMIAITQAAQSMVSWRLDRCILYVTLEPCPMCAGAIVQARIPWVVYGCVDPKAGACQSLYQLLNDPRLNHRSQVISGVLADDCSQVLSGFFQKMRNNRKAFPKFPP